MSTHEPPPDPQDQDASQVKDHLLFPRHPRAAQDATFPEVVFNANLQEFSQRVALICALESNGKLTPLDAFAQIEQLWKKLQYSKQTLFDSGM